MATIWVSMRIPVWCDNHTYSRGSVGYKFQASDDIVLCMIQLNLSARAYHRTRSVKLSRTIADLAGSEEIQSPHLAET